MLLELVQGFDVLLRPGVHGGHRLGGQSMSGCESLPNILPVFLDYIEPCQVLLELRCRLEFSQSLELHTLPGFSE